MPVNIDRNDFFKPERKYTGANFSGFKTSIKMQVFRKPVHKRAYFSMILGQQLRQTGYSCEF